LNKKISHEVMKLSNLLSILRTIRDLGPVSRVQIQRKTKLSWGTITTSIKELLERDIVKEIGAVNTGVGRRPVELDINIERNFALGVRLGSTLLRSVLLNAKREVIGYLKAPVDSLGSKEAILKQLYDITEKTMKEFSITIDKVAGIGIAAPGAVNAEEGICLYAPHHPAWKNVPLKSLLEDRFGVPCLVEHVNNCFALSEKWFGLGKGSNNFLCVLLGTGISVGIIINGEVYRGADGTAGEFGHIIIDPAGPKCVCGNNGCLEVYASGVAISKQAAEMVSKYGDPKILEIAEGKIENITGETVFLAAREGDKIALQLFEKVGHFLGIGISNLINLFNPEYIVLGGRISIASEFFLPKMKETIEERAWHASRRDLKISDLLVGKGGALGAAGMILNKIYNSDLLFQQ